MTAENLETLLASIDLSQPAPQEEPLRQYYFLKKCRLHVQKEAEKLGRPLTACVTTFGCQMNARDSEKLSGILEQAGYVLSDSEEADFDIYNTCTVRDNADQRVYGRLGRLNGLKKKNPHMKVALCGCMMQEPGTIEKIRKSYRFVDLIFGTHNIFKFAELLNAVFEQDGMIVDIWQGTDRIVEDLPVERKYAFKSGINIMFGCNNFCSYCIVPYVRGRERSRDPKDILREIKQLAADGVVEVMLLGQNVNSYGKNLEQPVTFAELLSEVVKIEGIRRVRFMTSHPKDLSDDLIRVMASSDKICRHLHLPLQSGSTRILRAMNRRYTKEQYLALVDRIRNAIPDIALTTDIIVGFPGETPEDVDETIDVIRRVGFDNAFTFIYSKRTGTPAASMQNQVPEELVRTGFDRVLKTVQETARQQVKRLSGRTMEALVEEVNEHDASLVTGRLSNNTLVHFPGDPSLIGQIVPVKLEEYKGFYFLGRRAEETKQDAAAHRQSGEP
ncbi:MAG TPA: tRNA (N6-isopentenyl adenosine(37)-C2)-methylthiotransferase MiaB [Candidatus Eisenbergiella intestinipullorum]|nr:tRNA (N6-isopentenyl adenosine(37)-C2)-methylthiotransferase MiaB [Candidatus Eisenbergiella intestinipullorum]